MFQKFTAKNENFKNHFILTIILIATLIISIIGVNYVIIEKEESMITAVNVSGQQRMLSQRIAFLSELLMHDFKHHDIDHSAIHNNREDTALLIAKYDDAITKMERNHTALTLGSEISGIPTPPKSLIKFYFGSKNNLDSVVKIYIKDAKIFRDRIIKGLSQNHISNEDRDILLATYEEIDRLALSEILTKLDKVVEIYQEEGRNAVSKLLLIEPILLILSLIVLFLLWSRIFSPLEQQLQRTLRAFELQKSESERQRKRFDLVFKGSSTGIWDWDVKTDIFYWSSVFQEIIGFDSDDEKTYEGKFCRGLLHPNDQDPFHQTLQKHLKTKEPFQYEGRIRHQKGHYLWVNIRGQAIQDDDGNANRMVGSIDDITQKREAEIQKNIFIQGIENSGLPFAIIDTNSRNFIYVTKSFQLLSGHDEKDLLDSNLNIFTGPETSMGELDAIDSAIQSKTGIKLKILSYKIDGSAFWNEISMEPIFDEDKNTAPFYAVMFNDLTDSLLREQKEINRQRNESLGALAASVAHEINNLLMPMTMAKDILNSELKEDCDPFAREQIETIDEYAHQAKEIVSGVLTFARKETENLEEANIYNLLNSSVAFIGNLLSSKTSIIIEEPDNQDVKNQKALVNTTEFRQIITNLAKNSEHAFDGKSGQISISFSLAHLSNAQRNDINLSATDFLIIHFTDNGRGIPKNIIPKIFDPLFTTKGIGQGTGLGLSVVHGIIRSWGGAIQVDSTKDVGTKFDLYIPIMQDNVDFNHLVDVVDEE